jgi:hypothetical protein
LGRRGCGVLDEAEGRGEAGGGEDGEEVFGVEGDGELVRGWEGLAVEEDFGGDGTIEGEGEAGAGGEGEAFAVAAGEGAGDGGGGPAFVGAGGVGAGGGVGVEAPVGMEGLLVFGWERQGEEEKESG